MARYSNSHSSETRPIEKNTVFEITYGYTSVPIYGSKFQNLGGGQKNSTKILKNGTFRLKAPPDAPRVSHPPQNGITI